MRKDDAKFNTKFISELGTKSKNNDFFGYVQLDNYAIWVITDGYDYDEGAEIASKIAVEAVIEYFMLRPRFNTEIIREMMNYANLKVKEKQEETDRYSLMHTSLLIVISNYNSILYGNIGNTRLYHIRDGYIMYQSKDDSIAQLLVDENALDVRDMKYHRQRNDLLQAIGDYGKIKLNISKKAIELQEKDIICLTTIGFWENVDESDMENEISRHDDKAHLLKSLDKKIIGSKGEIIENYTIAIIDIERKASPEAETRDNRKFYIRILSILLFIIIIILILVFWNIRKKNNIIKNATEFEQIANEELLKKNFNNSIEKLKQSINEYDKIKPKTKGILGFFVNAKNRELDVKRRIENVQQKINDTEKLKQSFKNILDANELFNGGSYEEASKKYQEAKYSLEQNAYKREELNIEELLGTLNTRIESSSKLKEAHLVEIAGDNAYLEGNYNLAKNTYKTASDMYLINGRADYISKIERKIEEINEKEKTAYNGAMLVENRGDVLAQTNINMSRESYYQARQIYQVLGDTVKTQEIDNKIQELNTKQMASIQTANNLVKEGLDQITVNKPVEALSLLTKAKNIYNELGDNNNENNVERYIQKAQEFIKFESETKEKLVNQEKEHKIELENKENEIRHEKERIEKIEKNIENDTNYEIQDDKMFNVKRYTESIQKYNESKKIYENLKSTVNFSDQTNKIEYISKKIMKAEGYLYEEQGDIESKNKKWKDAEQKYQLAKNNMDVSDVSVQDKIRVEKKLKKAMIKANKKWWQFWK